MKFTGKRVMGFLMVVVLGLGILFRPGQAGAQQMRASWSGASPANTHIWIAMDEGLFKKYGLGDMEVVNIDSSTTALPALLSNDVQIIVASVSTLVTSRLSGTDVVMIAGMIPTLVDHILVSPKIKTVADLKGKVGAVGRLGSTTDLGLRLALGKLGMDPNKDVKLLGSGNDFTRMAAISNGRVDFTIISPAFVVEGEKLGLKTLVNIPDLKIPFHFNALLTRESTIRANRSFVLNFLKAEIAAIAFFKQHEAQTKKIIGKYLRLKDPAALKAGYEDYRNIFPKAPYPNPAGVQTLLAALADKRPEAAKADPETFVDMSLVKELEQSGFILSLYQ